MAKKKKRSVTIIGAWIGFAGVIIAAAIALIPQISLEQQQPPELKKISRYDDLSGLFSIELPSVFKLKEREQVEDILYVTFHLDNEQIDFDPPEENYHVVFLYIQIAPFPGRVVLEDYMVETLIQDGNEAQFNDAMGDFSILDTLFIGDSTVINNEKTAKGFFIKKLITNINHELLPRLDKGYIFELDEIEPRGVAQVFMFLSEHAYLDYGNEMEVVVKSFKWDLTSISK